MSVALIPAPESLTEEPTAFSLDAGTVIVASVECARIAEQLALRLRASTGHALPVRDEATGSGRAISISVSTDLEPAEYTVVVEESGIRLTGGDVAGAFWATQTLLQLCPPRVFRRVPLEPTEWSIASVRISDRPRFGWRGMHLDVSRHFLGRDVVFKLLDVLALHRMNVLHLHLTDDQGWRIEIERYPELTRIGSWREAGRDNGPHDGFYTKEDLREIVAYAADRFITVVPEIELPGHVQAAIAAYPELGNTDERLDVWTSWGINPRVLNAEESTMRFFEHVLDEVLEIFPSEYVHIGGDEVPLDEWKASPAAQARIRELGLRDELELHGWITGRFVDYLAARGRRAIGWDEVLEAPIPQQTVVMSWRGVSGGIAAAGAGHDVVMAPDVPTYLNLRQAEDSGEQVLESWPTATLRQVYDFDPIPPDLPATAVPRILGAQCQMWTEYVVSERQMYRYLVPRLCAFAEAVWRTAPGEFDDFAGRLPAHLVRLHALDVDGFTTRPEPGASTLS
jgi:hexosaminidase